MKEQKEPLTFLIRSNQGNGELKVELGHPLVAHLNVAFEKGKPPGQWVRMVLLDQQNLPRIFGTFVLTAVKRLLFYPGGEIIIETPPTHLSHHLNEARLEHITLEKGFKTSHIRIFGRKQKEVNDNPAKAPTTDSMIPWFSLLMHQINGLYILPKLLTVNFAPRRPDLKKFGNQLMDADVVSAHICSIPVGADGFFQFDVWVGTGTDWRRLKSRPLAWAYKPKYVEGAPPEQKITPTIVDIEFTSEIGVRIYCSCPVGKLISPDGVSVFIWPTLNR